MSDHQYQINPNNWTDLKHRIRSKWNKLGAKEVDFVMKNLRFLREQLEASYGYSKFFAQDEVKRFMSQLPKHWLTGMPELVPIPKADPFQWLWPKRRTN